MAVLHKQSVSIINADKQALTLSVFSKHRMRWLISNISSCFRLFDIGLF